LGRVRKTNFAVKKAIFQILNVCL